MAGYWQMVRDAGESKIISALVEHPLSRKDLCAATGMSMPTLNKHLYRLLAEKRVGSALSFVPGRRGPPALVFSLT